MANQNNIPGLARGPWDTKSASVIDLTAKGAIDMGSLVKMDTAFTTQSSQSTLVPKVLQSTSLGENSYGIAVDGVTRGTYGDGSASSDDSTRAAAADGDAVTIVTQGRCPARVKGIKGTANAVINAGDPLTASATAGVLQLADSGEAIIARAADKITGGEGPWIMLVDVQREGELA